LQPYLLTKAAEADLRAIIHYTRQQWSDARTQKYITMLEQGMAALSLGKGYFKDISDLIPDLRMAHCGHHYIFCLPRPHAPAIIIAIFHERMDLMTRLKHRLDTI